MRYGISNWKAFDTLAEHAAIMQSEIDNVNLKCETLSVQEAEIIFALIEARAAVSRFIAIVREVRRS
jgi:hypothetical protein